MKKVIVCMVLLAVLSFGSRAYAYYEGYISWDTNLVASANWANSKSMLSWIVSFDASTDYWTYRYTLTTDGKPGISHVINEVSATFTSENIEVGTTGGYQLNTYSSSNPSNPGLPGDLYGLKFDVSAGSGGKNYTWTVVTDRAPMWGDFYAKGGSNGYVYNTEFGTANDSPIGNNANLFGWVLVPDTVTTVPEPATMLFLAFGLIGLAGMRRML